MLSALFKTTFIFLLTTNDILCGIMYSNHEIHKERASDGAYSPRDKSHFDDAGNHVDSFDHEAIIGSHKEAEEYDRLNPDESKRRLAILLKKMDLTNDGYIDRKELKAWILRSFKMLSEEEAEERLNDADENNDGIVTWAEYVSDTYGIDSDDNNSFTLDSDNLELLESDKILWSAADKNGDNKLDSIEWVLFSNPEEHPEMLPIILKQTLDDKDKDKDGSISFTEYIGQRGTELDREALHAEKVRFDEDLDKNHDGKLTGDEILSWVVPNNDEIAEEEVVHLFSHSDDDHDDLLSFDEILEHHDIFVGSEVTDYGDHLHNLHQFSDEL